MPDRNRNLFERSIDENFDVIAESSTVNQEMSEFKEYNLVKGTQILNLKYQVYSREYPQYVDGQSLYNDVWSLRVFDTNGKVYFAINRDVNSMLFDEPKWFSLV